MTPENFCYWLQGFFELNQNGTVTEEQYKKILKHLELVFTKSEITHKKSIQDIIKESSFLRADDIGTSMC